MTSLSRRASIALLVGVEIAASSARWLNAPEPAVWPLRVVLSTAAIAVLPGASLLLAALPARAWSISELFVFGFGISAALVQLAVITALLAHVSPLVILAALFTLTMACAIVAGRRNLTGTAVVMGGTDVLWAVVLAVLAAFLYVQGSPYASGEDYLHLGVIRRLSVLPRPALDNIYFAPGVIYTYPFPGIHYLMALVSRLGDVDPIFVYHKLRFFWGPVALGSLVVMGERMFGSRAAGLACGAAGAAFAAAGTFASVPSLIWGQLAPYSHASDVAMGVLLPVALAFCMAFLDAEEPRERRVLFAGAMGMVLMLTIVHIREIVQLLVYLGAFLLYLLWARRTDRLTARTALLLVSTLVIAVGFIVWQQTAVEHIGSLVSNERADLVRVVSSASLLELLQPPLPLFSSFVGYYWTLFWGWNPILLVSVPFLVVAYRRRPLVWLMAASVFCYLLIVRFPLFGVPYVYLTYFEILFTPVRNIILFLQLTAGASLLWIAYRLRGGGSGRAWVVGAIVCAALALVWRQPRMFLEQHQDVLLIPVLVVLGWMLFQSRQREAPAHAGAIPAGGDSTRWMAAAVACSLAAAALIVAWQVTSRPAPVINVRWDAKVSGAERVLQEVRFRLVKQRFMKGTTWSYALLDPSPRNVQALVASRAVADTNEIDRGRFLVNAAAPLGTDMAWAGSYLPVIGSPAGFDAVAIALIIAAIYAFRRSRRLRFGGRVFSGEQSVDAPEDVPPLFYAMVAALAVLTFTPQHSPLVSRTSLQRPADPVAGMSCGHSAARPAPYAPEGVTVVIKDLAACPPTPALMHWVSAHVPIDAVFAVDTWNDNPPSVFFPQQYVGWSGLNSNFLNPDQVFGPYLRFYRRSLAEHQAQPFFNDRETDAERQAFVEAVGVTHVLVDPAFHDVVVNALRGNSSFQKVYDADKWAVFQVTRR
jgi:hypothetical protein